MPWTSTVVPIQRIPKYTQHIQRFKKIQFLDIHVSKANTELPPIFYENKIYVSKAIDTWNMSFKDIYCFHLCFYLCWWSQELENIKSNLKKSNSSDINTFFNAHLELSSKKIPENTREVFFMKFEGNAYIPKEAEQKFKNLDMLFGDFFSENQVFFNIYQKCRMEMCDLVPNAINLRKS